MSKSMTKLFPFYFQLLYTIVLFIHCYNGFKNIINKVVQLLFLIIWRLCMLMEICFTTYRAQVLVRPYFQFGSVLVRHTSFISSLTIQEKCFSKQQYYRFTCLILLSVSLSISISPLSIYIYFFYSRSLSLSHSTDFLLRSLRNV